MPLLGDFCCLWKAVFILCLILSFSLVDCYHQRKLTPNQLEIQEHLDEQSRILDHLLKGYDKRLIPAIKGNVVNITLDVSINEVFCLDETKMESEMMLFIRQTWHDHRLSHNFSQMIKVREHLLDKIWLPDIRMSHLKDMKRFDGFGGINMNIHPSGRIYFSQLAFVKIRCPMDLHKFPMDKQTCSLTFSSYAYPRELMVFSLSKDVSVRPVFLPQFDYAGVEKIQDLQTSTAPKVTIAITFKRRWGYYLLQIYTPSIFLVVLSWLAFFMESSDVSDRLALEVTMILSIVFLLAGANSSLPHVSYAKASDWFIIVSFTFVFMALLETMLVYRLTSWNTSSQSQNQRNPLERHKKCCSNNCLSESKMEKIWLNDEMQNAHSGSQHQCSKLSSIHVESKPRGPAFWIDKICTIAFPASYTVFNIFYWVNYLK